MMLKVQQGNEGINSNCGNILTGALLQLKSMVKMNKLSTSRINYGEISHGDTWNYTYDGSGQLTSANKAGRGFQSSQIHKLRI